MQPLISRLDMIRRRIEREQCHPLPTVFGHVAKHPPHGIGVFEVVLINQFLVEVLTLRVLDEAHRNFVNQRWLSRSSGNRTVKQMN